MSSLPHFLQTKELARLCRVSLRTVEGWRKRRTGPQYVKLPTGQIRYPSEDVQKFIEGYHCPQSTEKRCVKEEHDVQLTTD